MELKDLEVYKLAREISAMGWKIYQCFTQEDKRTMGNQFIRSIDSVGANIAEGFGRYHYADKNRFYYNARASLFESAHWLEILHERNRIDVEAFKELDVRLPELHRKLNSFIRSTKMRSENSH